MSRNDEPHPPKKASKMKLKKGLRCKSCGRIIPYVSKFCPICGEEHKKNS